MGSGCRTAAWRIFENSDVGIATVARPRWGLDHEERGVRWESLSRALKIGGAGRDLDLPVVLFVVQRAGV